MIRRVLRRLFLKIPGVGRAYMRLASLEQNIVSLNARLANITTHKILQDRVYADYAHRLYSALKPMDVAGGKMIRKGRAFDGGYVMLDEIGANAIAYSFGISDDVSWDLDVAACGPKVFQYDHTISALPAQHPHFHFYKNGIAGTASADGLFKTVRGILQERGHWGRRDLILKMDIEGSEWDVLDTVEDGVLEHFSQIVIELHRLTNADVPGHAHKILEGLGKIDRSHQAVHVHANNWGYTGMLGGVFLPDTLEVTFVRKSDHRFQPCTKRFPTDIDMPCNENAPDIYLGRLGTG